MIESVTKFPIVEFVEVVKICKLLGDEAEIKKLPL